MKYNHNLYDTMKHQYPRLLSVLCALMIATSASWAVPAYRGWQTRTQPDGTTITIRQVGDEFYHYWETEDGKIAAEQPDGTFVVSNEQAPTGEQVVARRIAARNAKQPRRAKADYGAIQPTKLLVLLVNFSDKSMNASHNKAFFQNLLNGSLPSVQDYFRTSSGGNYVPVFDVFGPYTLPNNMAYYGGNDSDGNDQHPDQMVVDACALAYADGCNFADYDTNSDGKVDNIYVIYAGYGEAAGAPANTIWPHSWEIYSQYVSGTLKYNNKTLGHYACSAELSGKSGSNSDGVGTFAHEFSHVIGLPDYYDTDYGTNFDNGVTPGEWTLMDQGSYNGSGQYPPLYSIFDKYFMGWATPKFLAKDAKANVTMTTTWDDAYQITGGASKVACTSTSTVYYIENRQKSGYDQYLPGHGMLVWKVTYNATRWSQNDLNNTKGTLRYTIVPADGKTQNYGADSDPFPGKGKVKTWTPFTGCALTDITELAGNITFKYNGGIDCHAVVTNGTGCTITPSTTCVENGNSFTATITPTDETYDYTSLTVKLGSTTLTSGTHYTLSSDKKTLTVKAAAVTGSASDAFTITAVWTKNRYKYELLGENCTEELSGAVAKNAALNITVTPGAGYTLADADCWDVSMGGTPLTYGTGFTYNSSTHTFSIASVTGDVEIMAYGSPSVTWYANGNLLTSNVAVGGTLTLPDAPADCPNGKKFVGWTANSSVSGSKPSDLFTSAAGVTVTPGATYYAVYATASEGGSSTPTKATSIAVGDEVILVYENGNTKKEMSGFSSTSTVYGIVADYTTTPAGTYTFQVVAGSSTGTYALKHGSIYANWSSGNSLSSSETLNANSSWNISFTDGNAVIANANTSSRTIRYNTSSPRFACYTSGQSDVQLYKKGAGTTYSDYSLTCGELCALSSISLDTSLVQKSFAIGATLDYAGLVVTANYSNCSSQTVEPTGVTMSPDMSTAGSKTVTVTYTENGTTKTATYTINVVAPKTVTYMVCGDVFTTQNYAPGEALVLPENPGGYDGLTFAGWTTTEHYTGASAPAFISAGGAVNADVTYYAVFH